LAKTYFYGPITGGFAGDEPLVPGERIIPAFDQTHTGTAQLFYRSRWRGMWTGIAMRYGRGTIVENGPRLPQHFTSDLGAGTTLNEDLFLDNCGEMWFILAKLQPFLKEVREKAGIPHAFLRVEELATRAKEGRERLEVMMKRAEARRAAAAKLTS